ncbi:aminoacyl-tRNA hydrolase [Stappia sp. GBMRC 2046]|uniref:Peptidyl-tRNA hydrolase n=1 Tax=Stappia sediminis TaxID=2692190 RepID=A0A7X3S5N0_9HYPH|nr:aminoacyl-tRNA hydrolase [Stappia sediminis]MXN63347.1 aminoacyl-tRNA hydrolase [Stappia sediminis]
MRLIVGLGNPGPKYERNRHNVGFMAADEIHRRHAVFGPWRARFQSEVSEGVLGGEKTLLMKPQTYMNESGRAVGEAVRFFKLSPEDVCVLYDELDLAPGKTRMKKGGGHGGHNGLRSISAHIGPEYRRLRIGIGHPGRKELVTHWVLGDFAKSDRDWLEPLLDAISAEAPLLVEGKDSQFANRIHLATAPEKPAKPKQDQKPKPAATARAESETPPAKTGKDSKKGPLAEGLKRLFGSKGSD